MSSDLPQEPSTPPPFDDHVCFAIYSANLAVQRTYKPILDNLGITYPQYLVLNLLWANDGQTVRHLADSLFLEPSTLTPMLKRLEAEGLLSRTRSPVDERQVEIRLTDKGRDLYTIAGCVTARLKDRSKMTLDEILGINRLMRDFRDRLTDLSDRPLETD